MFCEKMKKKESEYIIVDNHQSTKVWSKNRRNNDEIRKQPENS